MVPLMNTVSTEGVEAPASQGTRREHTGGMRPTSNAARWDESAAECDHIHDRGHLAGWRNHSSLLASGFGLQASAAGYLPAS